MFGAELLATPIVAASGSDVGGTMNVTSWTASIQTPVSTGARILTATGGNDGYVYWDTAMASGNLYVSTSNTLAPDLSRGSSYVVSTCLNCVDAAPNNSRMYIYNIYANAPAGSTLYLWAVAVSSVDSTTSRRVCPTAITVTT